MSHFLRSPRLAAVAPPRLLLAALALLGAPAAVMLAWGLGVHALGGGWTVVALMLPLAGAAMLGGLALVLRGSGWDRRGWTTPRRSLWHLLWEVPVVLLGCAVTAAVLAHALGVTGTGGTGRAAGLDGLQASPVALGLCVLTMVVLVPLAEELFFRQLLLGWLAARLPLPVAVLACGVVFGLCHVSPTMMLYVVPLGLGLTALRVWHDSLWAGLLAHMTNNAVVAGLAVAALG